MPLPGPNKQCTLYECFDAYCASSSLRGDNQYETDSGEKIDAERALFFWSLPRIMVIHLKRWNMLGRKDQRQVECPIKLHMEQYVRGYGADSYVYELYAVCNHSGSTHGGHYTADVRPVGDQDWYEFNDTRIRKLARHTTSVSSAAAYCLFYRKKNTALHV
jgi:ubiquitin C-terminal hydrolase